MCKYIWVAIVSLVSLVLTTKDSERSKLLL